MAKVPGRLLAKLRDSHGDLARLEVPSSDLGRLLGHAGDVVNQLKELGYLYITLDLEGYRIGSMNEVLSK